jgi:hypothetical protein
MGAALMEDVKLATRIMNAMDASVMNELEIILTVGET